MPCDNIKCANCIPFFLSLGIDVMAAVNSNSILTEMQGLADANQRNDAEETTPEQQVY